MARPIDSTDADGESEIVATAERDAYDRIAEKVAEIQGNAGS